MSLLKSIFTKIIAFAIATMVIMPMNALAVTATTNMPSAEIGDYGNWLTPENVAMFNDNISADLSEFQAESRAAQLVSDYVPIEAKVGLALMNALSRISDILDSSLVRFSIIFMIIAYAFWILFEAYNMMSKGTSAMDFGVDAVKKGAVIAIWSIVLAFGPAQIFMWVMGPIIGVAAYLSDLILNAVSNVAGFEIPDTCAAIHAYTAANISENMIMDAKTAGDLLCVPTRLSGFFATAISAGWQWLVAGIGHSAFTMLVGAIFIGVFLYNGFKFMMMGLGVVVDLFLGVMMLPFTAIAETLKKTSYSGIAGSIFNGFLGLFNTQSLADQIKRFVNAAIYFVSLSMVIAVCAALLSGAVTVDLASDVPTLDNAGFTITLLTGVLVAHLAKRADEIAKKLGGSIDASFGTKLGSDITKLWNGTISKGKKLIKDIRSSKKTS